MSEKNQQQSQNKEREEAVDQVVEEKVNEPADQPAATGEENTITSLQKENEELRDKFLRLFAEFDNYKKRTLKEKVDLMKTAAQDTVSALLPVLDDFDRAKQNDEDENSEENFSEGVRLVYQKLYKILINRGLEPMETDGEVFDPELHEALTEIPAPSEEMKGRVISTVEKGYKLNDKIIRHAKVVVGK